MATLAGGVNPGGTITFMLYGPFDPTADPGTCTNGTAAGSATVTGNGTYPSSAVTVTRAGRYRWNTTYPQSLANNACSTSFGDAGETSTVNKATPTLTTSATATATAGQTIQDMATLAGGVNPGGTITFTLYGPFDPTADPGTCTNGTAAGSATVTGNGTYPSSAVTVTRAGRYRWIASCSGARSDNAESTGCGDAGEKSTVNKATPTLTTSATATATAGQTIQDMATLAGGVNPGGTITFTLYGPFDPTADPGTCTNGTAAGSATVTGNGTYPSSAVTVTRAGRYRWIASCSGARSDNAESTGCGDAGEKSTVNKATPTLTTSATATATAGQTIQDMATLAGGVNPGGTITFTLYGPFDPTADPGTCTNGTAAGSATVTGNGTYPSSAVTVTQAGRYRWIASYSGDPNNNRAGDHCGEAGEPSSVDKAPPPLNTSATATATAGQTIQDMATLAGVVNPGGTITFTLSGPFPPFFFNDTATTEIYTLSLHDALPISYPSSAVTVTQAGRYRWIASYSGDPNNN